MFKVINRFKDINHDNHLYEVGETYPAEGFEANEDRVSFLSKKHPSYGVAFLAEEKEQEVNDLASMSREELEKVKNDDLKAYLDKKEIEYSSNAVKDDLIKLVLGEE